MQSYTQSSRIQLTLKQILKVRQQLQIADALFLWRSTETLFSFVQRTTMGTSTLAMNGSSTLATVVNEATMLVECLYREIDIGDEKRITYEP